MKIQSIYYYSTAIRGHPTLLAYSVRGFESLIETRISCGAGSTSLATEKSTVQKIAVQYVYRNLWSKWLPLASRFLAGLCFNLDCKPDSKGIWDAISLNWPSDAANGSSHGCCRTVVSNGTYRNTCFCGAEWRHRFSIWLRTDSLQPHSPRVESCISCILLSSPELFFAFPALLLGIWD